ncbi:MAG: hypothetical protein Q8R28_23465 [Dehalococcoidia bacterium]|nr:hypothetical protein [Dehalococcoidia bacterium]
MTTRNACREKTQYGEVMRERMSDLIHGGREAPGEDDRMVSEEDLRSSHEEAPSASLVELRLVLNGAEGLGLGCDRSGLPPERRSSLAGRTKSGGVGSLSRRLMAVERARALGKNPPGFRVWALERGAKSGWRQRLKTSATARDGLERP